MPALERTPASAEQILNIAAYKFVRLDGLEALRGELRDKCYQLDLRGTILLSTEGINLFLAGIPNAVDEFLDFLRTRPDLADIPVKRSYSEKVPFRRMLVRLKREIIACGNDAIRPGQKTSPKLSPAELKKWLDEGRSFTLLDVRNKYEVELGTFETAEHFNLGHFRDFAQAISQLPTESKSEPLVMFCTGGIRCEKAGPLMEAEGFREIYQLDGGILKYFEECGGAHYKGSCFVFDGRVALDSELKPTGNLLCFNCQAVLTAEDVVSGKFMFGEYCPRCYLTPFERRRRRIQQRQETIRTSAYSQPGCTPYDNMLTIHVPGPYAGWRLLDFLADQHPSVDRSIWQTRIETGLITSGTTTCRAEQTVREGERFEHHVPGTVEPEINPEITLLYEDESLVVIDKPAPLPCHPSGRFNRNSLTSILADAYPNQKLRLAHRIDSNSTGLVLFCRRFSDARRVQPQFSNRQARKTYLVRVLGHPPWDVHRCDARISRQTGPGGRRCIDASGLEASSVFKVLERSKDGTTLLEAIPLTGRPNQLRLHLLHCGYGIVGDRLYQATRWRNCAEAVPQRDEVEIRRIAAESPPEEMFGKSARTESHDDGPLPQSANTPTSDILPASSEALHLHAWTLTILHPVTEERITFTAPRPAWA